MAVWQDEEQAELFRAWLRKALMDGGYTPVMVALAEAMEGVAGDRFEGLSYDEMVGWFDVAAKLRELAQE